MAKGYLSNRQKNLKIGITSYTENNTVLEVVGKVGIGTTNATSKLYVDGDTYITGILTANRIFSNIYGEFTGGSFSGTEIVGTALSISGISTLGIVQISSGIITATSGIVTYYGDGSKLTGVLADYANIAGVSTYATSSGIATYANTAGISTYATSSGIATYASTAGVSTALQNSRTFEITGDIIASPISFDGTGNVSLAATIQPNSVALITDTTGDFVQSITGTSNQITVTGGTGEGSTPTLSIPSQFTAPQDVTVTRDLQVNRNLNVNGNITIGGTSATLFTTEFKVYDPDIVLGFRTDGNGNDISTDNTANHGGIAVASTEGSPLIQLYDVGIGETNPSTYKKIMWFKSGTFTGLGTDAWLINYAVGIGSTQFPSGTRLAAGSVQFTERDLSVVRNINSSGIVTASSFVGALTGTATTATNLADAANITTGTINSNRLSGSYDINVSYANTAGVATVSQGLTGTPDISVNNINSSGISTLGGVEISSGIVTAASGVGIITYYGDGSKLTDINASLGISTNTANLNQYIPYVTSFGSTTGLGATNNFVFNPSTGNFGIGSTNPSQTLHVQGNTRVTGAIYDSTNSPGTSGQILQSTNTGTTWVTASNVPAGGSFDTSIDNVLFVQPTGTLDIVGVGTTTTQITTFPSGSSEYLIHSIHVTNISNGDAEVTAGFIINSKRVPASISVGGGPGIHTITVGSASSIVVGMAVTGTGNIGETVGVGSTAGFQFNTYVTNVSGGVLTFDKPLSGIVSGTAVFSPVSKVVSRLPVPVGSAVELLKQPFILNASDSIVIQSTGAGSGIGSTSTAAISQTSGSNFLTVTAGAAITNFIASGQLINGTGSNTGIQPNTYVGVGYTPGSLSVPMTRPATSTLASQILSFTETVVPQDGALQATIVYQSTTDTTYVNGVGIAGTISSAIYGAGATNSATIQSIRVANVSDSGDYPVWVAIGNTDTIFSYLAYNMVIPKNSSIELCEAPKRLGIGQSIFAFSDTANVIEVQVAGKLKT